MHSVHTETVSVESFAAAIVRGAMVETFVRLHSLNTLYQSNTLCLLSAYSSRQNKVPIVYQVCCVDCLRERRRGSGRDAVDLVVGPASAHIVNDNWLIASWAIPPGQ